MHYERRMNLITSRALIATLCLAAVACGDDSSSGGGAASATGGSTSTAGGAGGGGGSDCGCGPLEQCFAGQLCVAKLVTLPDGAAIDATEVTRDQWAAWLATSPDPAASPDADCAGTNLTYEPDNAWPERNCKPSDWPPGENGDHPVVCVGWCDARDYCAAIGKRLCGAKGGGMNPYPDFDDSAKSAWFAACSSGGAHVFPYGDTYEEMTCNGVGSGLGATAPVGSFTSCLSPDAAWSGVFDLSGNVREWEDSCSDGTGDVPCHLRGGSYFDDEIGNLPCGNDFYQYKLTSYWGDLGFRCCSL